MLYEDDRRPRMVTTVQPDPRWDPHGKEIDAQLAQRAAIARREKEVEKVITEAYPKAGQAVKIRMLNTGLRMEIGFQHAFRAIYEGFAELVRPDGSTWRVHQ